MEEYWRDQVNVMDRDMLESSTQQLTVQMSEKTLQVLITTAQLQIVMFTSATQLPEDARSAGLTEWEQVYRELSTPCEMVNILPEQRKKLRAAGRILSDDTLMERLWKAWEEMGGEWEEEEEAETAEDFRLRMEQALADALQEGLDHSVDEEVEKMPPEDCDLSDDEEERG